MFCVFRKNTDMKINILDLIQFPLLLMFAVFVNSQQVETLAGTGLDTTKSKDGQGTAATARSLYGATFDTEGNFFCGEPVSGIVRALDPQSNYVSTAVPVNVIGYPGDIEMDLDNNLFVADAAYRRIIKVRYQLLNGKRVYNSKSFYAGSGSMSFKDGLGTEAHFNKPTGLKFDGIGNFIVGDTDNHRIRKITFDRTVTTIAGSGMIGSVDGQGTQAQFDRPTTVNIDWDDNIYVAENGRIRKIEPNGYVSTVVSSYANYILPGIHGNIFFARGTEIYYGNVTLFTVWSGFDSQLPAGWMGRSVLPHGRALQEWHTTHLEI